MSYTTGPISVTKAGFYAWVAHYSGDTNGNRAVDGTCDDANETSFVEPLKPGLTTVAQAPDKQLPDTKLYDTAKVLPVTETLDTTGGQRRLLPLRPGRRHLLGRRRLQSLNRPVTVVDDGHGGYYATAESEHFHDAVAGTYRWVAHFDGDGNNQDADSGCNAADEEPRGRKGQPCGHDRRGRRVLGQDGVTLTDDATLTGGTTATATTGISDTSTNCSPATRSALPPCAAAPRHRPDQGTAPAPEPTLAGRPRAEGRRDTRTAQAETPTTPPRPTARRLREREGQPASRRSRPRCPPTSVVLGVNGTDLTDTATLADGTTTPKASGTIEFTLYGPFTSAPTANSCTALNVVRRRRRRPQPAVDRSRRQR